jgi:hypothetical protein
MTSAARAAAPTTQAGGTGWPAETRSQSLASIVTALAPSRRYPRHGAGSQDT